MQDAGFDIDDDVNDFGMSQSDPVIYDKNMVSRKGENDVGLGVVIEINNRMVC